MPGSPHNGSRVHWGKVFFNFSQTVVIRSSGGHQILSSQNVVQIPTQPGDQAPQDALFCSGLGGAAHRSPQDVLQAPALLGPTAGHAHHVEVHYWTLHLLVPLAMVLRGCTPLPPENRIRDIRTSPHPSGSRVRVAISLENGPLA